MRKTEDADGMRCAVSGAGNACTPPLAGKARPYGGFAEDGPVVMITQYLLPAPPMVQGGELPELAAFGILPLDPFPLRLALLPKLLTWVDREWSLGLKSASVLLSADSSGGETLRAALELTRRARYVLLDTGPGQAALEAELHQRLGLGSGGGPAVLEVGLGQRVRGGIPSLYLGRGCGAQQRLTVWSARLPEAEESMLCALFLAEKLSIGDIQVRFVEFRA